MVILAIPLKNSKRMSLYALMVSHVLIIVDLIRL
jgi:hypothetical protein